jgi:hypothetical protein
MPDGAEVYIDTAGLQEFLRSPNGPVARHLMIVGERIRVRTRASLKQGFPQDFLGPTIVKRVVPSPDGPTVRVGSEHVRTKPHPIDAPDPTEGRPNPHLRFLWPKVGPGFFYAKHVNHPGSNFTKYLGRKLSDALQSVPL